MTWQDFWTLRVNDRLRQWTDFRQQLDKLPFDLALVELNEMWSSAPQVNYALDQSSNKNWPTPWELLAETNYCTIAKALGIMYTIYFTRHRSTDVELRVYYNYDDKERHAVAWFKGGEYILNYWPFEIVNTKQIQEKQLKLLYQYTSKDLKLESY
jgi:hypothetical protein|tara:strand:+ start:69 stop:533 length:465 start_codon:yes stop_codon:yes gene_type:complete